MLFQFEFALTFLQARGLQPLTLKEPSWQKKKKKRELQSPTLLF